ncbi:ras-like GTP-binding protein rhoA [Galendromus occidentalis]|uniref:Ras-like GTP-binding protein rhoA n=1 Tax=Galendromus occidentalis TaxID=34638 RepID=A0AAJ6QRX5_9ACAR|nr:ras-like GTP-binding protein rhoA [Galendromus occidentalis]
MGRAVLVRPSCVTTMTSESPENYKKIVIVGDGNCGKTSLLTRFAHGDFPRTYIPTVFDTDVSSVSVDGKDVRLSLWDTAGQEAYEKLRPLSYNDTDVVIIAYSVADRDTMANVIEKWYPEISYYLPDVPVVLVGTKLDLRPPLDEMNFNERQKCKFVSVDDGRNLAGYIKADAFIECSALADVAVCDVFRKAAQLSIRRRKRRRKKKKHSCSVL